VVACPNWPGDSSGFQKIASHIAAFTHYLQIGQAEIQAIPLGELINTAQKLISADPLALLPDEGSGSLRGQAVRQAVVEKNKK